MFTVRQTWALNPAAEKSSCWARMWLAHAGR
jgi:hypothetical protein